MAPKGIEDFGKEIESSTDVQKEVGDAYGQLGDALKQAHETYCKRVVSIAQQHGFEVTAEEVGQKFDQGAEDVSDDRLDSVAGGRLSAQRVKLTPNVKPMTSINKLPGRDQLPGT